MFSSRRLILKLWLAVVSVALISSTGCGLRTGEESPSKKPPSYSGKGFSCVGRIPEHADKFVNDQLSEGEITTFVSCLQQAFTTFAQLTRGRSDTYYAPEEIRNFLHEFFLGERRVSDDLMREFMVLKQALVGGELDRISRAELYVAVEILEELKVEAIRLKPHIKVLNPRLAVQQDPAQVGQLLIEANETLNITIGVIARRLQRSHSSYPLANLENLLRETRAFVAWETHFQNAIPPGKWVNFLSVFRQLTVAPTDSSVVRSGDWAPMLQSFSNWYFIFLHYEVGVKNQPLLSGMGLQNSMQLAQEVFKLLEQCLSQQKGQTIAYGRIFEMTQALSELRWLPQEVRPSSAIVALQALITRVLGNPNIPAGERRSEGLTLDSVARAREIFYRWSYAQLNLDSHMNPDRLGGVKLEQPPNLQGKLYVNPDIRSKIIGLKTSEWEDFLKVRTLIRPLFSDGYDRVMLVGRDETSAYGVTHGFYDLSMKNLWRAVSELIFRGYAEKAGSDITWESGITSEEMQKFYEDFREIGIDLRLIDERNAAAGARAFIEGNLFTYEADGLKTDDGTVSSRLTMVETVELFSFLYSGGRMAYDFYNELLLTCDKGPVDIKARPTLARACVVEKMPELLDKYLLNMPHLRQYLSAMTPEERQDYGRTLIETSFSPRFSQVDWVEMNEMSTLAVVLHYAEAVMTRYDKDHNGQLTNGEIEDAAQVFTGFIKKFAKDKKDQNLTDAQAKASFYYILIHREMPEGYSDIFSLLWFSTPQLSLNRSDLSGVFRVIIAKLFETPKESPPLAKPEDAMKSAYPCYAEPLSRQKNDFMPGQNLFAGPELHIWPVWPNCWTPSINP